MLQAYRGGSSQADERQDMGLRVAVCEMPDGEAEWDAWWSLLLDVLHRERPGLLLLPELAFCPWLPGAARFDRQAWEEAVQCQSRWLARLSEAGPTAVLTTRAAERDGLRVNEAVLCSDGGFRVLHRKTCLPAEDGYHETAWFSPGTAAPATTGIGPARAGVAICSELWLFERARVLAAAGAHLLLTPRATTRGWNERWLLAGRVVALAAGVHSLSSNRVSTGPAGSGGQDFGGQGWVIGPDGEVAAVTGPDQPVVVAEVDLAAAEAARSTYPRYVTAPFDQAAASGPGR
jgi:N-carbamoylputrescine amidase